MAEYDHERAVAAGIDRAAVDRLVQRAQREIDQGLLPSCQLALAREGEVAVDVSMGEEDAGARYVIFSCTKAITAAAVWRLLGDGRLHRGTRVAEVVPSFGTHGKEVITVEQLLTHTAGFPQAPLGPPEWSDRAARLERFSRWRLNWEPGSRFEYHPTSAHWVLAELVEAVTGTDYRRWIRDQVLVPMGLSHLRLGAPDGEPVEAAEIRIVGEPPTPDEIEAVLGVRLDLGELQGEVTDEAKLLFSDPAVLAVGVPGGGAISTAADLAVFYQRLLHDPAGLFDPEVLRLATGTILCDMPDPILGHPANRTLGLTMAGSPEAAPLLGFGRTGSVSMFGHLGAGGQIAWADPETGLSFAYLTNGHDAHVIREARRTVALSSLAAVTAGRAGP